VPRGLRPCLEPRCPVLVRQGRCGARAAPVWTSKQPVARVRVLAVQIRADAVATVEVRVPRILFQTGLNPLPALGEYAVTRDGQRFLVVEPVGGKSQAITLLLNWRPPAY
jgi:hypothetical protein